MSGAGGVWEELNDDGNACDRVSVRHDALAYYVVSAGSGILGPGTCNMNLSNGISKGEAWNGVTDLEKGIVSRICPRQRVVACGSSLEQGELLAAYIANVLGLSVQMPSGSMPSSYVNLRTNLAK